MMNSYAEENYLKVIYKLSVIIKKRVVTKSIAEKTATKPSSVTDMIKKLAEKKLISYEKYHGVRKQNIAHACCRICRGDSSGKRNQ